MGGGRRAKANFLCCCWAGLPLVPTQFCDRSVGFAMQMKQGQELGHRSHNHPSFWDLTSEGGS